MAIILLLIILIIMIEVLTILNYKIINDSIKDIRERLSIYEKKLIGIEIQIEKVFNTVLKVVDRMKHYKMW